MVFVVGETVFAAELPDRVRRPRYVFAAFG